MEKKLVNPYLLAAQTIAPSPANLLVASDKEGKPNAMTISWGFVGEMWHKPVFIAAVRPSRYTYELWKSCRNSVNVAYPHAESPCHLRHQIRTGSGQVPGLRPHPIPARKVAPPIIAECAICYECRVIHTASAEPVSSHKLYFGEIGLPRRSGSYRWSSAGRVSCC